MASETLVVAHGAWNVDVEGQLRSPDQAYQRRNQPVNHSNARLATQSDHQFDSVIQETPRPQKYALARWIDPTTFIRAITTCTWHALSRNIRANPSLPREPPEPYPPISERTKFFNRDSNGVIQERLQVSMRRTPIRRLKNAGQRLFICVDHGRRGQFAIQVPCLRPTRHRRVRRSIETTDKSGQPVTNLMLEKLSRTEQACESDGAIVERIQRRLRRELGSWVRLIPYYGVVDVEIVEFRFLYRYSGQRYLPIIVDERDDGSSITQEARKDCKDVMQHWRIALKHNHGFDPCKQPKHLQECPAAMNWRLPCMGLKQGPAGKSNGVRTMMCEKTEYHDEEFCPGQHDCMKERMEQASRVSIPGLQAFERLPELLRRPIDVNYLPLSKWMKQEGLLHDVRVLKDPGEGPSGINAHYGRDTLRGVRFKVGWDFKRLRIDLPCHLSLVWIAASAVWLGVILWATETDDNNTAMAFGSLLLGIFNFLFFNSSTLKT